MIDRRIPQQEFNIEIVSTLNIQLKNVVLEDVEPHRSIREISGTPVHDVYVISYDVYF